MSLFDFQVNVYLTVCSTLHLFPTIDFSPLFFLNPLTPMSDQDRISPHNINTESSRQVRRIKMKTKLGNNELIQYQILQIEMVSVLWRTVGRITNEILGV